MAELTFHLTSVEVWSRQAASPTYRPDTFEIDGFVHCTNGEAAVLEAGNRYYQVDSRPYVCLTVDLELVTAPVRYDDPGQVYPHVYGAIDRSAILAVRPVVRNDRGHFVSLDGPVEE